MEILVRMTSVRAQIALGPAHKKVGGAACANECLRSRVSVKIFSYSCWELRNFLESASPLPSVG